MGLIARPSLHKGGFDRTFTPPPAFTSVYSLTFNGSDEELSGTLVASSPLKTVTTTLSCGIKFLR